MSIVVGALRFVAGNNRIVGQRDDAEITYELGMGIEPRQLSELSPFVVCAYLKVAAQAKPTAPTSEAEIYDKMFVNGMITAKMYNGECPLINRTHN